ncbi:response regulator [Microvirga brassicacearum]|uniref:histidine kinase n=1 Tax=Microvirga brassicacearum TaxID=2580413 RepID=A0A5N3PBJ9_9HYPH|nr:response regulator [Microvirga brassicacearum]KAB0267080.1 response regulator [Microvirga brassicacearum]
MVVKSSLYSASWSRVLRFFKRVRTELRRRPDSEHEMTINRFVLSGVVLAYLSIASALGSADAAVMLRETAIYFAAYDLLSLLLFCHILYRPGVSVTRRLLAIVLDLGLFSYGVAVGGESTAALYPIYLWVILGNGFRFGVKYLFAASFVAVIGFGSVIVVSEFWRTHLALSAGLLAGLVVLPLYVSRLIAKLSEAQRQAEAASRAKSLFIASVSHELRTPLNAIIGLGNLLGKTKLDSDQGNMARTITTAGQSLLGLINSILDFSRVESGVRRAVMAEFDVYASLENVRRMLAVQVGEKKLRLSLHITPRTPRFLKGDLHALEGPLVNLVGNAVKFTQEGYVTIAADAIERQGGEITLRVEISDTGIGISPEAQTRIFESFTQADETIVDRFGGTGLGLATSKQLVERAGGTIGVESAPGAGSTFWFEIDFSASEKAAAPADPVNVSYVLLSRDPVVQRQLASGRSLAVAETPQETMALLSQPRAAASRPVVLLLDAAMVTADAVEDFANRFAQKDGRDKLAIVLIGATDEDDLPHPSLRSLCVSRLSRPLEPQAVVRTLAIAESGFFASPSPASDHVPDRGKPLSVLVADDNRTNQMVLSKILGLANHTVALVDDGEAALDALEEGSFDIVLMDVNMPVLNGIDATKLYRFAALGQKTVPIVALTADASPDTQRRCSEAGMVACISKPVDAEELLTAISAIVAGDQSGEPAPPSRAVPAAVRTEPLLAMPARNARFAPVDQRTLDRLEQLGDKQFVQELAQLFADDAGKTIEDIGSAVANGDARAFQDSVHALRSSAANIGALEIFKMCLAWRDASPRDLAVNGEEYLVLVRDEFDRVCESLGVAPAVSPSRLEKSAEWHHTRRQ